MNTLLSCVGYTYSFPFLDPKTGIENNFERRANSGAIMEPSNFTKALTLALKGPHWKVALWRLFETRREFMAAFFGLVEYRRHPTICCKIARRRICLSKVAYRKDIETWCELVSGSTVRNSSFWLKLMIILRWASGRYWGRDQRTRKKGGLTKVGAITVLFFTMYGRSIQYILQIIQNIWYL